MFNQLEDLCKTKWNFQIRIKMLKTWLVLMHNHWHKTQLLKKISHCGDAG